MNAGALNPGLWFEETGRYRQLEARLLGLWRERGYAEVLPPLLMPLASARSVSPAALASSTLRVEAAGEEPLALRSDFTASLVWMASRRLEALSVPMRCCYAGAVARLPARLGDSEIECLQAGCERVSPEAGPEGDEEVALLAAESLTRLGLPEAVLEFGHWGIVGPLLGRLPWPPEARAAIERALNRKSLATISSLAREHGGTPETDLLQKLLHVGGRPEEVDCLLPQLDSAGAGGAWIALRELETSVRREFPRLGLRLDPADVRHWSYYTGLTLKAFTPRHPRAVLAGGRYDGLYETLGPPFGACGFALYVGLLLPSPRGG